MYAELLIAASLAVAAYQDVKDRAVSDIVWVPAAAAVALTLYSLYASGGGGLEFYLVKLVLIGGLALGFTFLGGIGQADGIAIAAVAADPYFLSPLAPLLGAAVVAGVHIAYEFARGNAGRRKTIPMAQFLREQRWIPKAIVSGEARTEVSRDVNVARDEVEASGKPDAMVEVSYGVPTVAYLGIGFAAYVAYMLLFSYAAFAALP
ncbi:MAG: hypothetical protein JRM74_02455 [Nitrososphaerota archaeon]|nr:hypothetical protein [Nitrososphaerota archaeon]MDG6956252.1 hypothetical protein [Nitrososphaerota archaeon]MDG6957747.1 hypothetical protein [Nitrososphaerota archaeon]MDG6959736.1 hypothetical protein [Nitrososphaerota archaeon]MDG6968154.1 hypothetical protein [Nitrososphaerota archaeon]